MPRTILCLVAGCLCLLSTTHARAQTNPVYPLEARRVESLERATKELDRFSDEQLIKLVPVQSGLYYVGCPNCRGGRQENQLSWSSDKPDAVTCRFCKHEYPSQEYPMNESVRVHTPTGKDAVYPYWQNSDGYRFFFQAKRDDEVRLALSQYTLNLAQLYRLTNQREYGRRAALLLNRFAEVFPDWCYHYDYPFRQKEIYDGAVSPKQFALDIEQRAGRGGLTAIYRSNLCWRTMRCAEPTSFNHCQTS